MPWNPMGLIIKTSSGTQPNGSMRGIEDGVGLCGVDHLSCPS